MRHDLKPKAGFTLTELVVLVAMGAILTGLWLPDLSQTRSKLLEQACVSNLKQWGVAMLAYAEDHNGFLVGGLPDWQSNTDSCGKPNGYVPYFGGGNPTATMRRMRICPAHAATMTVDQVVNTDGIHDYGAASPMAKNPLTGTYSSIILIRNFRGCANKAYVNIRAVPKPAEFLLMFDAAVDIGGRGYSVSPGGLADYCQPITNRHSGGVNMLRADGHVEYVPYQALVDNDNLPPPPTNSWFTMN